tara:strand:+ start:1056 stop:2054 length:999 start_codon:yes stop_codon:yes gene_type:complete
MTETYKSLWNNYLDIIRPDLSIQSKKLYSNQLNKIQHHNNLKKFDVSVFIHSLCNKAMKNKSLDFITLDGSEQSKNQRLSAIRNILEANKEIIIAKKYNNLFSLLSSVGEEVRNKISFTAGENKKTEDEENNMKATWDELNEYAIDYVPPLYSTTGMRDHLILNLLLNNYTETDGVKYFVLLRIIEYSSLLLWTNKKQPPADSNNYIWLDKSKLFIQHSKTTGGVKRVKDVIVQQPKNKIYSLSPRITEIINMYIKSNKLKNGDSIFNTNSATFSKILINLLKKFGDNVNSTMLRKIFENREVKHLNANQTTEMNKNLDHSVGIVNTYYKKF